MKRMDWIWLCLFIPFAGVSIFSFMTLVSMPECLPFAMKLPFWIDGIGVGGVAGAVLIYAIKDAFRK